MSGEGGWRIRGGKGVFLGGNEHRSLGLRPIHSTRHRSHPVVSETSAARAGRRARPKLPARTCRDRITGPDYGAGLSNRRREQISGPSISPGADYHRSGGEKSRRPGRLRALRAKYFARRSRKAEESLVYNDETSSEHTAISRRFI
jgi:hypothetical protein